MTEARVTLPGPDRWRVHLEICDVPDGRIVVRAISERRQIFVETLKDASKCHDAIRARTRFLRAPRMDRRTRAHKSAGNGSAMTADKIKERADAKLAELPRASTSTLLMLFTNMDDLMCWFFPAWRSLLPRHEALLKEIGVRIVRAVNAEIDRRIPIP